MKPRSSRALWPFAALLLLLAPAAFAVDAASAGEPTSPAAAAFERFKALSGGWQGRSTAGWEARHSVALIARGTVVLGTSHFEAHPGETMATAIHLDGDRLVLTHYCVAGNQPRLEATAFEDGGRTITFTFRDATNLPSRDHGHMDKVVYRLPEGDPDRYTSRWTWYQDGRETWLEEITMERVP